MSIDYSDEVGFPAQPTRVYIDPRPLLGGWRDESVERRLDKLEASRKWKAANRETVLAKDREYQRRRRALRKEGRL